jgi:uncharacterized protein (TIGR03435 family)
MANSTDQELLAVFVKNGSESAFSALVAKYVNLVYSTALRHTNNPHHAEEITQAVFILLARKAGSISSKAVLSGWLYQAARLTAANYRRDNQRRQQREQKALMESALNVPADEPWKLIAPVLDEAMNALGITDRDAVLLRFFENKPLAEVGAALGVSEAAAEKRVSRALERLHAMLSKQGVALGATTMAGAITANAVQAAPGALAGTITAAALTATSLTSATVAMTTLQKIGATAVLAATVGGGIYAAKQASDAHKEVRQLQAQQAPLVEQIRRLQSSLTDATNRIAEAENSELKSGKDKEEVLRLRGQIAAMRTQLAGLQNKTLETTSVVPEKIWKEYSKVFARDLTGREKAPERVAAFAEVMTNHPPIVLVRLSPEQPSAVKAILSQPQELRTPRLKGIQLPEGSVAMGAFLIEVVRYAYELGPQFPQNRIIVPDDLANVRYDYIDTMPEGPDALQRALKEQLGLVARREMRSSLILTVKNPARGLHKHAEGEGASEFRVRNSNMGELAHQLSKLLGVAVTDQTQLEDGYDFTLNLRPGATTDEKKAAILDQLGLQVTPAADGQQIEFLVIEKPQ